VTDVKAYAHEVDVLQGQIKKAGVAVTMQKIGALRKIVSDSLYEEVSRTCRSRGAEIIACGCGDASLEAFAWRRSDDHAAPSSRTA
jgi:hypothetical protein